MSFCVATEKTMKVPSRVIEFVNRYRQEIAVGLGFVSGALASEAGRIAARMFCCENHIYVLRAIHWGVILGYGAILVTALAIKGRRVSAPHKVEG